MFSNVFRCTLVVASHLEDLVLIDSILVCGARASENCSVLAVLESGQLLMLSSWQQATSALQMDHCTLFELITFRKQLHCTVMHCTYYKTIMFHFSSKTATYMFQVYVLHVHSFQLLFHSLSYVV